ncbi:MAG: filamentous hemagglutinin N-terminal domain-containing protein, partial [Calothrix sp. MO_167.B42]|nr:filamentous hemagglutinin N-terminal domain-containing protein [Calothrix sp. MO_167.B42]
MMKKVYKSLLCVALPLATVGTLASVSSVTAQSITPDATLGNESSVVNTNVDVGKGIPSDRIDGGATRGNNLFHSFSNFNVDAGRGAFFSNPTGIENIVSRVTGSNISNILGTLGVLGNANLFFANPNGIVFGPNARLDVSGSFFATTSDSFTFGNGFEFSASNPQAPPLLTVNIPIGLRFRDNPGSITNESVAANTDNTPVGLQVLPGRTLALVGGDVNFEGGRVTAPGARVEIGGLSTEGVVGINDDLSLSFPEGVARADVLFNNAARVDVRGVDRGSIIINAKDLNILGGSRLDAGIFPNSGSQGAQAGDIVINAENKLTIQGENTSSAIANVVGENAQGNAGNVLINANSLEGKGLFAIGSSTFAQGDAGKVTITATEKVSFKGSQQFSGSGIASAVAPLAVGDAKDVTINTPSLSLSNFSQITTSTSGQGNAANIQINASKSVSVNSGSLLQATSFSSGNAGKIIIEAEGADVSFDGVGTAASTSVAGRSEILGVQVIGTGQGDDIKIKARNLSVTNGAQLSTSTSGEVGTSGLLPNAGNIQINVSDNIFLNEGSRIRSETFGFGNAGSVTIGGINGNLPKISFDGTNGTLSSGIFTTVERVTPEPTEPRIGGDINITAQSLELKDGAQINSSTFGVGNAGNISIDVREGVFLQGFQDEFSSGIFSDVGSISRFARGDAGSIDIKAGNLSVTNGARISSSTFDIGNAGNINIDVREGVFLQGNNDILTAIRSNVENFGNGKGGNIKIKATNLSLLDGADIQTAVRGRSSDGNPAGIGNAGNVQINVSGDIILNKGSQIRSDTFGFGNAGSVTIDGINGDLPDISFDGTGVFGGRTFDSGIFTTVGRVTPEPAESRIGGDINITAQSLELTNGAAIDSSTSGKGNAGRVNIQVENGDLTLDNSSNIFSNVESGAIGDAGNIDVEIKTGNLFITKGSQIQSIVRGANGNLSAGEGNTGKITIKIDNGNLNLSDIGDNGLPNLISTSYFGANSNSDVVTKQGAGDIEITATGLSMTDGARLLSVTAGTRNAGDIQINVSGDIKLNEGSQIRSDTFGFGNAGSVTIGGINGNLPKISFDG